MPLQLRQLCLVVQDLDGSIDQFGEIFGLQPGFVDDAVEQFGARNTLLPLGTDFIELITPLSADAPSQRFLDAKGGDAGYMVITQSDSREIQRAIRAQAQRLGVRVAFEISARKADFLQWHPADTGGSFLETTFDHVGELEGHWDPAGGYACSEIKGRYPLKLLKVGITTENPGATAERWGQLTLSPPGNDAADNPRITLNNASIYFIGPDTEHPRQGLDRINLTSPAVETILANARQAGALKADGGIRICGVDIHLRAPDPAFI